MPGGNPWKYGDEDDRIAAGFGGQAAEGNPEGTGDDAGLSRRIGGHQEIQHFPSGEREIQSQPGFFGSGGGRTGEGNSDEGKVRVFRWQRF